MEVNFSHDLFDVDINNILPTSVPKNAVYRVSGSQQNPYIRIRLIPCDIQGRLGQKICKSKKENNVNVLGGQGLLCRLC